MWPLSEFEGSSPKNTTKVEKVFVLKNVDNQKTKHTVLDRSWDSDSRDGRLTGDYSCNDKLFSCQLLN